MLRNEPTQRLSTLVGDLTTPSGAHTLVSYLNSRVQAGLDHVVSITGGRHAPAKLTQLRGGDFKETMQNVRPCLLPSPGTRLTHHTCARRKCCRTLCWRRRRCRT